MNNLFSVWCYLYIILIFFIHKRYIVVVYISIIYMLFYSNIDLLLIQLINAIPNAFRIPFCVLFYLFIYIWMYIIIVLSVFLLSLDLNNLIDTYTKTMNRIDTSLIDITFFIICLYYIVIQ